jgi:replication factor A1
MLAVHISGASFFSSSQHDLNVYRYASCPEENVQKKVVQQPDGSWFCESTGACYPTCEYRYIASMKIGDHTDSTWCTGFNDVAVKLLGKTADEMHNLKEENEEVRE